MELFYDLSIVLYLTVRAMALFNTEIASRGIQKLCKIFLRFGYNLFGFPIKLYLELLKR